MSALPKSLRTARNESRMQEPNVTVTVSMAYSWGEEIAKRHFPDSVVFAQWNPTD